MNKFSILLFLLVLCSCSSYDRQDGCTLDFLYLKGNVKKVEVISLTGIPLTEMLDVNYHSDIALPILSGNFSMTFDNHGNINKYIGYGVDGKVLFEKTDFKKAQKDNLIAVLIGKIDFNEFDDIQFIKDDQGRVCEIKYLKEGKPIRNVQQAFDENGDGRIITERDFRLGTGFLERRDTTIFSYLEYDTNNNWTKAKVVYRGFLRRHDFTYIAKRSITYDTYNEKETILSNIPEQVKEMQQAEKCCFLPIATDILSIEIPDFMKDISNNNYDDCPFPSPIGKNDLFSYEYNAGDSYAYISAGIAPTLGLNFDELCGADLIYNSDTDRNLEQAVRNQTAPNGIYILKWLPYKIAKLAGKKCLKISYYRYGMGSPIPVYFENYIFNLNDYYDVELGISYQSKDYYRFHDCFEHSKQSLKFID